MKKLSPSVMEKTQGGFLGAFLLGMLVGVIFLIVQDGYANSRS
jgi:hypothetical protein